MRPAPDLAGRQFDLGRAGILQTGAIVQHYPGKRILYQASLSGCPALAKFYLGAWRNVYEWWRGVRGARALVVSGVPTARLYYAGYLRAAASWLAVYEWIEADEIWPPQDTEQALPRLLQTLVEHHQKGIVQHDLSLRNFIPCQNRLFAIDGDRVRLHTGPLNRKKSIRHLLYMYASKSRFPESTVAAGYRFYLQQRGWPVDQREEQAFMRALRRRRRNHALKVARRAARGWKYYPRLSWEQGSAIYDRRILNQEELQELACRLSYYAENGPPGPLPGSSGQLRAVSLTDIRQGIKAWIHFLTLGRLGLPVERQAALLSLGPKSKNESAVWLLQLYQGPKKLQYCLQSMTDQELSALRQELQLLLDSLYKYRIRLGRDPVSVLGWDGQKLYVQDTSTLRLESWFLPGFDRRWQKEMQILEKI